MNKFKLTFLVLEHFECREINEGILRSHLYSDIGWKYIAILLERGHGTVSSEMFAEDRRRGDFKIPSIMD